MRGESGFNFVKNPIQWRWAVKIGKNSTILFGILLLLAGMACSLLPSGDRTNPQPVNPQPVPPNNQAPPANNVNPPENNNNNPNNTAQFQLEGTWGSQTDTQYGVVNYELILEHTRTFSQQVILGDLLTYDVGTYAVGDGFIRFIVENHEPKTYKGKDMHWLTSFTYFYTVVDAGSMIFEDRIAGTQWTVYRR
jgi:hypothetical protein